MFCIPFQGFSSFTTVLEGMVFHNHSFILTNVTDAATACFTDAAVAFVSLTTAAKSRVGGRLKKLKLEKIGKEERWRRRKKGEKQRRRRM